MNNTVWTLGENKPNSPGLPGNPKHETRNPKQVERMLLEKTKPIYRRGKLALSQ